MSTFLALLQSAAVHVAGDEIGKSVVANDKLCLPGVFLSAFFQQYEAPGTQFHAHISMDFGSGGHSETLTACFAAFGDDAPTQIASRWARQVLPLFASLRAARGVHGAQHFEPDDEVVSGAHGFLSPIWTVGDSSVDVAGVPFFAAIPQPHPTGTGTLRLAKATLAATDGRWHLSNEINGHEHGFRIDPFDVSLPIPSKPSISTVFALYFFPPRADDPSAEHGHVR